MKTTVVSGAGFLALFLATAGPAAAQTATGQITGAITDATGATVTGVRIKSTNTLTGLTREATSSDRGTYAVPQLPVGTYVITAEKDGFKLAVSSANELKVDQVLRVDMIMELEVDPTNANAAYEVAEIHRKGGEASRARAFFQRALDNYPDFEEALVGLGRTLVALQDPRAAIPALTRAIELNPKSDVAYYQLAQAYRALGDTAAQEKALATFRQVRSLPPAATPGSPRPEVTKQTLDPDKPVR